MVDNTAVIYVWGVLTALYLIYTCHPQGCAGFHPAYPGLVSTPLKGMELTVPNKGSPIFKFPPI